MCFLGRDEWEDVEDIVEGHSTKNPKHVNYWFNLKDALFLEIESQ
jgi:hypothetical protein